MRIAQSCGARGPTPSRAEGGRVADYADEWIATQAGRLRPKTLDRHSGDLRLHVVPRLGRRKIGSVTPDDVAVLIADMQRRGYAAWTIRGVLTALGRVLGNAARRGMIATNPVSQLERSERPKVMRAVFPSPPMPDPPPGYVTRIRVNRVTGQGPWAQNG